MKIEKSSYFVIFFLLLGLFGIIQSIRFQHLQSILLPLIMSSVIFALALVEIIKQNRKQEKIEPAPEGVAEKISTVQNEWRRFCLAMSWIIGFAMCIYLFGFMIAIPLFILSYFKQQGAGWFKAILFAGVTTVAVYAIFEIGLKNPLLKGVVLKSF